MLRIMAYQWLRYSRCGRVLVYDACLYMMRDASMGYFRTGLVGLVDGGDSVSCNVIAIMHMINIPHTIWVIQPITLYCHAYWLTATVHTYNGDVCVWVRCGRLPTIWYAHSTDSTSTKQTRFRSTLASLSRQLWQSASQSIIILGFSNQIKTMLISSYNSGFFFTYDWKKSHSHASPAFSMSFVLFAKALSWTLCAVAISRPLLSSHITRTLSTQIQNELFGTVDYCW